MPPSQRFTRNCVRARPSKKNERIRDLLDACQRALREHACVELNRGKNPHLEQKNTQLPVAHCHLPSRRQRKPRSRLPRHRLGCPRAATSSGSRCASARAPALLDPLGDHRAACATSGALGSHPFPLERAAATVCQEAGTRVAMCALPT